MDGGVGLPAFARRFVCSGAYFRNAGMCKWRFRRRSTRPPTMGSKSTRGTKRSSVSTSNTLSTTAPSRASRLWCTRRGESIPRYVAVCCRVFGSAFCRVVCSELQRVAIFGRFLQCATHALRLSCPFIAQGPERHTATNTTKHCHKHYKTLRQHTTTTHYNNTLQQHTTTTHCHTLVFR